MFFTNNTWYVTSDWEYLYFYSHSHSPPPPSPSDGRLHAVHHTGLSLEKSSQLPVYTWVARDSATQLHLGEKTPSSVANLKCWTQFHSKCYTAKLKYSCPRTRHIDPGQGLNTDWPVQSPLSVTSSLLERLTQNCREMFISIQGSIWKFIAKLAILLKET